MKYRSAEIAERILEDLRVDSGMQLFGEGGVGAGFFWMRLPVIGAQNRQKLQGKDVVAAWSKILYECR